MIVVISLIIVFIVIGIIFLTPKGFWHRDTGVWELLINRSSLALLISVCLLGLSLLYFIWLTDSATLLQNSEAKEFLDTLITLPILIAFAFGFFEGDSFAYSVIVIEIILLTLVIRLVLSKRWVKDIRNKIRDAVSLKTP